MTPHVSVAWGTRWTAWAPAPDLAVVVDVLTFSTTVNVALNHGLRCIAAIPGAPVPSAGPNAIWSGPRGSHTFSLSPESVLALAPGSEVVLASPNGGAATVLLAETIKTVLIGSLRNAAAVADWVRRNAPHRVMLVAAGEKWPDGSLRPALEDWLGVGAVAAELPEAWLASDARAARAACLDARDRLAEVLRASDSGRELVERGFARDIAWAADYGVSQKVAVAGPGGVIERSR